MSEFDCDFASESVRVIVRVNVRITVFECVNVRVCDCV